MSTQLPHPPATPTPSSFPPDAQARPAQSAQSTTQPHRPSEPASIEARGQDATRFEDSGALLTLLFPAARRRQPAEDD